MPHLDKYMAAKSASKKTKSKKKYSGSTQNKVSQVKAQVKKTLGLTTVPNTPPPGQKWGGMDSSTSTIAMNLKGKDRWMYGQEASKATDDAMVEAGLVKVGNYFKQEGGNFIKLSKEEGEKLYKAGDPSVSRSTIGDTTSKNIKYGQLHGGVMGSGDSSGVLSSIPISNKMLQSQNVQKSFILGAIGAVAPTPVSMVSKLGFASAAADALQPGAAYEEYTNKFKATQGGKKFTSTRNLFGLLKEQHKKKTLQASFDKKKAAFDKEKLGTGFLNETLGKGDLYN